MVLITGNTYPHRAAFRAMGGEWDATAKGWKVPEDKADEARAMVGRPAPRRFSRYGGGRTVSHYTRFASGHESYTNRNGRCEDAPCCGCCS